MTTPPAPEPRDESARPAGSSVPSYSLPHALARLRQEAEHGVVDTGRYRCRYFRWGQGPALILIPGLSLAATSFAMALERLHTQFTCIGYELPAAGDGLRHYRHTDLRDDLFTLLDHLRVERGYLLGFSFGSTIALAALAGQPTRFPRALLLGGFARRTLAWTEVLLLSWLRYCPGRIAHIPGFQALVRRDNAAFFADRPAAEFDDFCTAECSGLLRTFAGRALLMHHTDMRPLLGQIQQPLLLIHGDRDPLVSGALQDELKAGLPNAARAEIEGCGHYPQLSHPAIFTELVQQFLTRAACPALPDALRH